jgi:hypothetical protein
VSDSENAARPAWFARFARLPIWVVLDPALDDGARVTLAYIVARLYAESGWYAFSATEIARHRGRSERQVRRDLTVLRGRGYLVARLTKFGGTLEWSLGPSLTIEGAPPDIHVTPGHRCHGVPGSTGQQRPAVDRAAAPARSTGGSLDSQGNQVSAANARESSRDPHEDLTSERDPRTPMSAPPDTGVRPPRTPMSAPPDTGVRDHEKIIESRSERITREEGARAHAREAPLSHDGSPSRGSSRDHGAQTRSRSPSKGPAKARERDPVDELLRAEGVKVAGLTSKNRRAAAQLVIDFEKRLGPWHEKAGLYRKHVERRSLLAIAVLAIDTAAAGENVFKPISIMGCAYEEWARDRRADTFALVDHFHEYLDAGAGALAAELAP